MRPRIGPQDQQSHCQHKSASQDQCASLDDHHGTHFKLIIEDDREAKLMACIK